MTQSQRLQVHLDFGAGSTPLPLGECLWVASQRLAAFQWRKEVLGSGLDLSPLQIPLTPGVHMAPPTPFGGLHGMLADSIPDGFGLRLMDKSLASAGYGFGSVTPVHRLAWVGSRGIGALTYTPVIETGKTGETRRLLEICELGEHAARADVEDFKDIPEAAIRAGGSAHGARPKFWASVSADGTQALLGDDMKTPTGFTPCLVKFAPARGDRNEPFYEAACLELAQRHGVRAARARLLKHPPRRRPRGRAIRPPAGRRSCLRPKLGRAAARRLARFQVRQLPPGPRSRPDSRAWPNPESERVHRQVCFNVAMSAGDVHSKNFAFCMDCAALETHRARKKARSAKGPSPTTAASPPLGAPGQAHRSTTMPSCQLRSAIFGGATLRRPVHASICKSEGFPSVHDQPETALQDR